MVAQIARGGQEGRPAIFIAAIAFDAFRRLERAIDQAAVLFIERKAEDPQIVGTVLALAQAGADDDGSDRLLLQHPARCDIGNRDAVLAGNRRERSENTLQHVPAADPIDEAHVFHRAPVADIGRSRLGPAMPSIGKKPARQCAIG